MGHSTQAGEDKLQQLATEFRRALLACPKDEFSGFQRRRLQNFPKQSCDVASLLLAYHLRDHGFQNIERVFGYLGNESHVWLEVDGWIVDVTADQFPGVYAAVIVARIQDDSWHAKIRVQSRAPAYSLPAVRAEYEKAYAALKRCMATGGTQPESCQ